MSRSVPRVFLDTNILKLAVDERAVWRSCPKTVTWGPILVTADVAEPGLQYPNQKLVLKMQQQARCLPKIAALAKAGTVALWVQDEVLMEFMGLPRIRGTKGLFYKAPLQRIPAPHEYSRIVASGCNSARDLQVGFVRGIQSKRLSELARACGVHNGGKHADNQMIDAFHLWCAESAGADYFLTCDMRLINALRRSRLAPAAPELVTPTELLAVVLPWPQRLAEQIRVRLARRR